MQKRITAVVLVLVLAGMACGPITTPTLPPVLPTEPPADTVPDLPTTDPLPGWLTYANADCSFQIRVPPGSIITPGADSDIIGLPFVPGTNLSEKYIEVTCRTGVVPCESPYAEGFAPGSLPVEIRNINGTTFAVMSGGDAGAGNYYNWTAYSTSTGSLCIDLSFMLHSVNAMNYTPPIPEFDQAAESAIFDEIMATFTW